MGDSTIMGLTNKSYPQILGGVLPHGSYAVMGFLGSDFFTYYALTGALLERDRPDVLVIVAHLRLFAPPHRNWGGLSPVRPDLVSLIPDAELPYAMTLPFGTRGITLSWFLLARLLRYDVVERAYYVADGARTRVAASETWLGPDGVNPPGRGFVAMDTMLRESDVPISRTQAMVRMLDATVSLARAHGVHVVIVGTPLPFQAMQATTGYDPAVYRRRFETLRAVTEEAGGRFVDLHEGLPGDRFLDFVGHFDERGAALLAERIRPVVAGELLAAERDRTREPSRPPP
jgi:hypothetical protein